MKIIFFKENRGQSAALYAGFKASKGRWIISLDADLQNPPREIHKLTAFKHDYDFITGIRANRKDNFLKIASSTTARFFRWLILQDRTTDTGCSLRVFRREVVDSLSYFKNFHRFFTFLVRIKGFSVKEVCINHRPRRFGRSKYGVLKRAEQGIGDLWHLFWLKRRLS